MTAIITASTNTFLEEYPKVETKDEKNKVEEFTGQQDKEVIQITADIETLENTEIVDYEIEK